MDEDSAARAEAEYQARLRAAEAERRARAEQWAAQRTAEEAAREKDRRNRQHADVEALEDYLGRRRLADWERENAQWLLSTLRAMPPVLYHDIKRPWYGRDVTLNEVRYGGLDPITAMLGLLSNRDEGRIRGERRHVIEQELRERIETLQREWPARRAERERGAAEAERRLAAEEQYRAAEREWDRTTGDWLAAAWGVRVPYEWIETQRVVWERWLAPKAARIAALTKEFRVTGEALRRAQPIAPDAAARARTGPELSATETRYLGQLARANEATVAFVHDRAEEAQLAQEYIAAALRRNLEVVQESERMATHLMLTETEPADLPARPRPSDFGLDR